jgi:hypothetical protein
MIGPTTESSRPASRQDHQHQQFQQRTLGRRTGGDLQIANRLAVTIGEHLEPE